MPDFQLGDRVTTFHGAYSGTVKDADEQSVTVCWDGEEDEGVLPGALLGHVPVTAEHVGQWARGTDPYGETKYTGVVEDLHQRGIVGLRLTDDDYADVRDAVLVAPPAPVAWSPTVGARAQVAVAEYWGCHGIEPSSAFVIGDLVTVERFMGADVEVSHEDGRRGLLRNPGSLRPVPADQPDPAQDTGPERGEPLAQWEIDMMRPPEQWRVSGLTDFLVRDGNGDVVAMVVGPEDAARAVAAVNAEAGLRADVQRLSDEKRELRTAFLALDGRYAVVLAERDAARAELAAAHAHDTGGLGLPEVDAHRVRVWRDGDLLLASYDGIQCDSVQATGPYSGPRTLREIAATTIALANERARLADEATPDKETQR